MCHARGHLKTEGVAFLEAALSGWDAFVFKANGFIRFARVRMDHGRGRIAEVPVSVYHLAAFRPAPQLCRIRSISILSIIFPLIGAPEA